MESISVSEMGIQRFWPRRLGQYLEDDTSADVLLENEMLFPPALVQVNSF